MSWWRDIARADIRAFAPYSHAEWQPGLVRLHANESPWRTAADDSEAGLNIYPEPHPFAFEAQLAAHFAVPPQCLLATRGSDEAIDLLVRAYCAAGASAVVHTPPTFGMYSVAARVQGARVISVPLDRSNGFALDSERLLASVTPETRLVFLCSPNNPTGNQFPRAQLLGIAAALAGRALLVVDEAYVDFADEPSLGDCLAEHPGLALLRTLSKAQALAGARCGMLLAHPEVIALLRGIIQPYAVSQLTIEAVRRSLAADGAGLRERIAAIREGRARLFASLPRLPGVIRVWPSSANFLLTQFADAAAAVRRARAAGMLLRDFSANPLLEGAVRITVGSAAQNDRLLECLA